MKKSASAQIQTLALYAPSQLSGSGFLWCCAHCRAEEVGRASNTGHLSQQGFRDLQSTGPGSLHLLVWTGCSNRGGGGRGEAESTPKQISTDYPDWWESMLCALGSQSLRPPFFSRGKSSARGKVLEIRAAQIDPSHACCVTGLLPGGKDWWERMKVVKKWAGEWAAAFKPCATFHSPR